MRALLVSILLAGAAVASAPSASAADADPVCVPPASGNGVCVGTIGDDTCVWAWLGPSFRAVCLDDENQDVLLCQNGGCQSVRDLIVPAIAQPDPVCVPPGTLNGVCVGFLDGNICAWAWLGPSFNALCVDVGGPDILVCDNSGCESILRAQTAAALPMPSPECDPDFAGVCTWSGPGGSCVGANIGTQGASACTRPETGVRVCTSARSVLWEGSCPSDGLTLGPLGDLVAPL